MRAPPLHVRVPVGAAASARAPAAILALGVWLALAGTAGAQGAEAGVLWLHHTAPVAGRTLTIVLEGAAPDAPVHFWVDDATRAPTALVTLLTEIGGPWQREVVPYPALFVSTSASAGGLVVLSFPLDDPDAQRELTMIALQDGRQSNELRLEILPPMVLVPTEAGLARVDLRDGRELRPSLLGDPLLLGAALSASGRRAFLLRDGGELELRDTASWQKLLGGGPLLDASVDVLASEGVGPLVALARPLGDPYALPGRLLVVETADARPPEVVDEVALESLAAPVAGRRLALDAEGTVAFVAEDDLLVREVDLLAGERRLPFTVGAAGDRVIADMLLRGRHLFVLTRRGAGLAGTLTRLDRDRGVTLFPLTFDPARLVAIDDARVLVVPAEGAEALLVDVRLQAVPWRLPAEGATWRDAGVLADGRVAVLAAAPDGSATLAWLDPVRGWTGEVLALPGAPTRLVTGGGDAAVLLGDPEGRVLSWHARDGETVRVLPGIAARPDLPFAIVR